MKDLVFSGIDNIVVYANERILNRIFSHLQFIKKRTEEGKKENSDLKQPSIFDF